MDQGGFPLSRRISTKRSYSQMADPRHTDDPDSLFLPAHSHTEPDDHYNNDHRPQRRRLESLRPEPPPPPHFPGDGLDYRRPVMSTWGMNESVAAGEGSGATQPLETIDLTDDASAERVQNMDRQVRPAPEASPRQAPRSSHAQRLPHFGRNIIDLDDSDGEEPVRPEPRLREYFTGHRPAADRPPRLQSISGLALPDPTVSLRRRGDSMRARDGPSTGSTDVSDVEVTGSRPRSHMPSRRPTPMPFAGRDAAPPGDVGTNNATIDLTADDDDDVVLTNIRINGGVNGDRPAMAGSVRDEPDYGGLGMGRLANTMLSRGRAFPAAVAGIHQFLTRAHQAYPNPTAEGRAVAARRRRVEADLAIRRNYARDHQDEFGGVIDELFGEAPRAPAAAMGPMGMALDYDAVAFDLGTGGRPRQATPKYEPPPTTGTGFTRSPEEDEIVVCPNCGDELAVGESEVKQQVYVNKRCGHAYCGDCVTRPKATRKGKGKATESGPLPFKKCVVLGCTQIASKASMIHVYMQ